MALINNDVGKAFNSVSIPTGGTVTFTWDKVIPTDLNPGGQYIVTFTADTKSHTCTTCGLPEGEETWIGEFNETNESDNVITGTFTVDAAP